jgi:hypothetical protein
MIYILSLIAAALAVLFYKNTIPQISSSQRILLIVLRSISLIVILILLINPILYLIRSELNRSKIIILNDVSESMFIINEDSTKTDRINQFDQILADKFTDSDCDVVHLDFASGLQKNPANTYLIPTLEELVKSQKSSNIEEIYLLSDGWFQDDDLNAVNDLEIPISTFDPQFSSSDFDLEIKTLKFNRTFFKDELNTFIVDLAAENYSEKAELNFYVKNELIKSVEIDFSEDKFQQIFFDHSFNNPGLFPVEFKLTTASKNESNQANNFFPSAVNVLKDKTRILIISDKLSWDVKFLKDAVMRNPRWQAKFLLKDQGLKFKTAPVFLDDEMENTEVLLLINNHSLSFTQLEKQLIYNHVERGGGVFLQGKPISSLGDLMPVIDTGIDRIFSSTIYFTEDSDKYESFNFSNPEVSKNIPPVRYFYVDPKLQSEVLAGINNEAKSPAIVFTQFEKGKILYFSFFDLWKWQLHEGDDTYRKFVNDLLNWVGMGNADRFISFTDKNSYFTGEIVRVDLQAFDEKLSRLKDLNAKLTLTKREGKIVFENYLDYGEDGYFSEITDLEAGEYSYLINDEVHQQQTSGRFIVTEDNAEKRDKGFNIPLLAFISEVTGGKIYTKANVDEIRIPETTLKTITKKLEIPIYRKWYLIACFLICFCLEIFLRKRWGLL